MSEQNPYGGPPPASQPYGAPPPPPGPPGFGPPQPPAYGYPQQPAPYGGQPAGYGVPAQQPWGGGITPQPQKSRKGLWIVLGCVGGAILLGGGLLGYFVYDVTSKTDKYRISLPSSFQGLPREDSNPLAQKLESGLNDSLGKGENAWSPTPVSTVYTDRQTVVAVFGGYGTVLAPSSQIDDFFKNFEEGARSQGTTFSGRRDFDAGPLGGRLTCEVMHAPTEDDSLCAWADGSTFVAVLTGEVDQDSEVDLDEAATAARELRRIAEVPK
ncbi:hypothetical protein [Kitasatospora sp. KL5]|uniref:hypothetical protein n=1 Tax=Kitasatospora sp. KL5 TaxID=3425125 RepID=UPI003D6E4C7C